MIGALRANEREDGAVQGLQEGKLVAEKSTAATLGGWIDYEDESG